MQYDPLRSAIGSYRNYTDINGKIENGIYYDPIRRFQMEVPYLVQPGATIRGQLDQSGGSIQFSDDMGKLIRVDVVTANSPDALSILNNPDWNSVLSLNREYMLGLYQSVSPQTTLIHQEFIKQQGRGLDYYVCKLPQGSTLADVQTKKRHDALRASISFREGNSIFVVTKQHILGLWRKNEDEDELVKKMKDDLLKILPTISFN